MTHLPGDTCEAANRLFKVLEKDNDLLRGEINRLHKKLDFVMENSYAIEDIGENHRIKLTLKDLYEEMQK